MKTGLKQFLVLGMSACLAFTSLTGCGKKDELDLTAAAASMDGQDVSAGVVNFMLRYEQAQFESSYGAWLKSYYPDLWNSDLMGAGEAYGVTFKDQIMNTLERLLLTEKHASDYGIELSEEDKAAITQAAQDFLAANETEVLDKMSATQENVERVLTLRTIQARVEEQMSADVDTEVSDEEAAQRTVSYVRFSPETEEETEAETAEGDTEVSGEDSSEASTEASSEAAETENETMPEEEDASEAGVTEAEAVKTGAADTEAETEAANEGTETEASSEGANTEAETESSTEETETETEDAATIAAKAEAREKAEAFLAQAKDAEDFAAAASEIAETADSITTSSYTFGDNDTYPDASIIEATKGLEDGAVVDEVIEVGDAYYVLHVDDAFNEEATAEEKETIVNQRKMDAVNALYDEWSEAVEFTVNEDVYGKLVFDLSLTMETEASTEAETEAGTETEAAAEEETAEAQTEAAETEAEETDAAGTEAEEDTETDSAAAAETEVAETEVSATETETTEAETEA